MSIYFAVNKFCDMHNIVLLFMAEIISLTKKLNSFIIAKVTAF